MAESDAGKPASRSTLGNVFRYWNADSTADPTLGAQGWKADARRLEPTIDGDGLAGHIGRAIRA